MNKSHNKKALYVLAGLVCIGLAWYIFKQLEWREQRFDLGWEPEALIHPYLAAERYLIKLGVDVDSYSVLPEISEINRADALFIPDTSYLPFKHQQTAILDWVENGGHLLTAPDSNEFPNFIADLGFSTEYRQLAVFKSDDDDEQQEEDTPSFVEALQEQNELLKQQNNTDDLIICTAAENQCNETTDPDRNTDVMTVLTFDGSDDRVLIDAQKPRALLHPHYQYESETVRESLTNEDQYQKADVFYWASDDNAVRFVQVRYGEGLISISVDSNMFDNARLGHFDHAYLLEHLFGSREKAIFLEGKFTPPLSSLAVRHYPEAIAILVLLILISIWHLSPRFGAVHIPRSLARRSREESLRAIAQWRWRRAEYSKILTPVRDDLLRAANKRWPQFKYWPKDMQCEKLAEYSNMDIENIETALDAEHCADEHALLRLIQVMQTIRKTL